MKYQDLKPAIKRSINGSLYYHFDSGCLDFKGAEVAFSLWEHIKFYEGDGGYYFRGSRRIGDSYLDPEQFNELKQIFKERYESRMNSLYWSNKFLRT